MKVHINEEWIRRGVRKSHTHDPACMAIKHAIKVTFRTETYNVIIQDLDYIFINGAIFDMPIELVEFCKAWDRKRLVTPITFDLEIPEDFFLYNPTPRKR